MAIRALNIGSITLPGNGYPPIEAFDIPVADGLTGAFFLGDGPDVATINFAGGDRTAAVVGEPVWEDGYASLGPNGRIDTNITETLAMSIVAIVRRTNSAANTGFAGNFIGASDFGVSLYAQVGATSVIGGGGRIGDPSGMTAQGTGTIDAWTLGVVSVPATGALTTYNKTSNTSALSASTANREISGGGPMRIGADYNRSGACDIALVMFYNRALTLSEVDAITAWARAYADRSSITV